VASIAVAGVRDEPAVTQLMRAAGPDAVLARAWSVPVLGGNVYLVRAGETSCLSVPDPATAEPDLERAEACGVSAFGTSLSVGGSYVAIVAPHAADPVLKEPGAGERRLVPTAGLVAVDDAPDGSTVTLFDGDGHSRTEGIGAPSTVVPPPSG
jgi:hypothetical protein